MASQARSLINKVWALCDILRDGGITYQDYLTELSWLLYLCFSGFDDTKVEDPQVVEAWSTLRATPPEKMLREYQDLLSSLGESSDPTTARIFADAKTRITDSHVFAMLINAIGRIDWGQVGAQALGDIYEGILERNAQEQKSGAGQYFTPRSVVELMVRAISPKPSEIVQDPAAGTGGFLVIADAHARQKLGESPDSSYDTIKPDYFGVELVPGAHRLCLMNLSLHGVPAQIYLGSTLDDIGAGLPAPDVILTNPPFGSKRGADRIKRPDLTYQTSNKQLAFLQHVYKKLKEGGRAALVIPDGVLFDNGLARNIRQEMLRLCNVHTILRLPGGLFYALGIKTNVIFLEKPVMPGPGRPDATKHTWIYDARTGISARTQVAKTATVFADFERIFRLDYAGRAQVADSHPRLACFTRSELRDRNDRLDLSVASPGSAEVRSRRDPVKTIYAIREALTEALDLVDQLEADFRYSEPDYEP